MSAVATQTASVIPPESEGKLHPSAVPDQAEIAARAYRFRLWLERGCPLGSEDLDWLEQKKR